MRAPVTNACVGFRERRTILSRRVVSGRTFVAYLCNFFFPRTPVMHALAPAPFQVKMEIDEHIQHECNSDGAKTRENTESQH